MQGTSKKIWSEDSVKLRPNQIRNLAGSLMKVIRLQFRFEEKGKSYAISNAVFPGTVRVS